MTRVLYPIPYEFIGLTARMTTNREFQVSDEIELEIEDVTSLETMRIATGNFSWQTQNLPGQGGYNRDEVRHQINPAADIRLFKDRFYAPVRKFNMDRDENVAANAIDVGRTIGSFEFTIAHPFERLHQKQYDHRNDLYTKHRYGRLKTLMQHKLIERSERDALLEREDVIASTKDDISTYIAIDGEIWKRLEHEPVISVSTLGAKIDLMIEARVDIGAHNTDYFRLSELEECLEFVAVKYPGKPIRQHFANLDVLIPEAFVFDAEADALVRTAHTVERDLARGALGREGVFQAAYEHLQNLVFRTKNICSEDYVEALQKLNDTWNEENLPTTAKDTRIKLKLTLDRWEMRPVRSAGMRL